MKKKVLSLALTLALCLGLLPSMALAEGGRATSGTCGANLTWTLSNRTLTISGTGAMEDYTGSYFAPWKRGRDSTAMYDDFFSRNDGIQRIVIGEGVTTIGSSAFSLARSLTSVSLPSTLTSIGNEAFSQCQNLTDITLPQGLTSIGRRAFASCESLTSLPLPDSLTTLGASVFDRCKKLTDISLPSGLTDISYGIFEECESLRTMDLPYGMTEIGMSFFSGCKSLTHVTIPDSVTKIELVAFKGCASLTSLDIPDSVNKIDRAFPESGLTSITFPVGVTEVASNAFERCNNLTTVVLSEGVTRIGQYAFNRCESLSSITLPKSLTKVESEAFANCYALRDVYYGGSSADWNAINVQNNNSGNQPLLNATIHYNSDVPSAQPQQPAEQKPEIPEQPTTPVQPQPSAIPTTGTAYASTQSVLVDGKAVEFQMYALKDAQGNDTNYIKLRDLAQILNGTAAQFEVGWNGAVNIETGKAYTPNGSEMKTPFSGNRTYESATSVTNINGSAANLTAFILKDDNGGAYTYYRLRDLGEALGFNVDWASGKGIFVETDKPYSN